MWQYNERARGYVWTGYPAPPDYSTHPEESLRRGAEQTSKDWKISGAFAVNSVTGERYKIDYSDVEGSARGTKRNLENAILYYLNTGNIPDEDTSGDGINRGKRAWRNISTGLDTFIKTNNLQTVGKDASGNPTVTPAAGNLEGAEDIYTGPFNAYYENDFNVAGPYAEGNSGQALYDNLAGVYMNQANTQGAVANAQYQQQAMQQAAVVKQITDQVRGERMARLKAGMSESQIANQDMQMMMANVDTLNQNAMMLNQGRLEAQGNMATAKDQAYMDYLGQSTARGQVSTGQYAADAGNAYWQTIQQMRDRFGPDATKWTQQQWKEVNEPVIQGYGTNNE